MPVQDWGTVTAKGNRFFVHLLNKPATESITLEGLTGKPESVSVLGSGEQLKYKKTKEGLMIYHLYKGDQPDYIIEVTTK